MTSSGGDRPKRPGRRTRTVAEASGAPAGTESVGVPADRSEHEAAARAAVMSIVRAARTGAATGVGSIEQLPPTDEHITRTDRAQDVRLKRIYANWLLGTLLGQLVVADTVFVFYAWLGRDWNLSAVVIDSWLAATFLEIVGIVYVVTNYLFPKRDGSSGDKKQSVP